MRDLTTITPVRRKVCARCHRPIAPQRRRMSPSRRPWVRQGRLDVPATAAMAAGDRLLDGSGNRILLGDGTRVLSDGASDDCCCACVVSCPVSPKPECCLRLDDAGYDEVPDSMSLTIFEAFGLDKCQFDTAPPYHVWKMFATGLFGVTFTPIPFIGSCQWYAEFDVTGLVGVNYCVGNGTGGCYCEPDTPLDTTVVMTVTITPGSITLTLQVTMIDLGEGLPGVFNVDFNYGLDCINTYSTCCQAWSIVCDPLTSGSALDWTTVYFTNLTVTPCP